ncbi:MAG: hypothetical protein H7233_01720 [Pseudorhodobacter sp.]|nr:hypothetical protein [Frankiaceae bacterium]
MDGHTVQGSATVPWSKDAKHTGTTVSVGATFSTSKGVLDAVFAGPPALDDPFQPTPYDDFLPPNNTSPEGEGYVRFSALPKVATATGTTITEGATVYFDEHLADGGSSLATNSWSNKVDSAAPTAVAVTARAVSLTAAVPVTWSASVPTGVGTYDVQVASAPYGKPLGTYRAWKTATSLTKASWPGTAGGTYCFKVRAIDVLGNASAFTTSPVCTAVPLAASRFAFTPGFRKVAGTAAYIKVFYQSLVAGQSATITTTGRNLSVLAYRCSTCGSVKVYWKGRYVRTLSLVATKAAWSQVLLAVTQTASSAGVLKLVTVSTKPVRLEGLVVLRDK